MKIAAIKVSAVRFYAKYGKRRRGDPPGRPYIKQGARMSRVGKNPIQIPTGVDVKLQGNIVSVKGPKGELSWNLPSGISISMQDKQHKSGEAV